jgi:hypothetical protein
MRVVLLISMGLLVCIGLYVTFIMPTPSYSDLYPVSRTKDLSSTLESLNIGSFSVKNKLSEYTIYRYQLF